MFLNKMTAKQSSLHDLFSVSLSLCFLSGCATTHKGKALESMAIGAVVGGLYGQSRSEFKQENALLFSSMGAATGALITEFTSDIDKENQKKLEAFNELEKTMRNSETTDNKEDRQILSKGPIFNGSAVVSSTRIPQKLKKVLNGGNLTGFKADEWIEWDSNRAAHIDEIWELNPAEFNLSK